MDAKDADINLFMGILHPQRDPALFVPLGNLQLQRIDKLARRHGLLVLTYSQLQKYYREHSEPSSIGQYLEDLKLTFLNTRDWLSLGRVTAWGGLASFGKSTSWYTLWAEAFADCSRG